MVQIGVGKEIRIACKIQPGPFSEEHVVTVDTIDGPISGFVRKENLVRLKDQWYVRGIVRDIKKDVVSVWIKGSFFTTNGLANVPRHLAQAA